MTMERTAAKIGRRMKKWEKFMRHSSSGCGGGLCRGLPGFRVHDQPGPGPQQPFHNDLLAGLQPFFYDAEAFNHRPDLYGPKLNLLLRVDHIDELYRLVRAQRPVRNQ